MMQTVQEILTQVGYQSVEEMDINDGITLESAGFDDLSIEKVGENLLSVSQYYVQRGDVMCDPEIVFRIEDGRWMPIEYIQHPRVHEFDDNGLEMDGFLDRWDANLREQGFIDEAARTAMTQ